MNGGAISDNIAGYSGGGVAGRLEMNGGVISGNTAGVGGGVDVSSFDFNGGFIFGNTAASYADLRFTGSFRNNVSDPSIGAIGSRPN